MDLSDGNCFGQPELTKYFFSPRDYIRERMKQTYCSNCPAIFRCRSVAEPWGVWGGLDEQDRRRARKSNFSLVLEELHEDASQRNKQRDINHLVDAVPFSLSHISFQNTHTPSALFVIPAFPPVLSVFDTAS